MIPVFSLINCLNFLLQNIGLQLVSIKYADTCPKKSEGYACRCGKKDNGENWYKFFFSPGLRNCLYNI